MPFCNPDRIIVLDDRFRIATTNDPDVVEMAKSIKQCGQLQPILVTKNKELIDGLHRLIACKSLNCDVWYEDEMTARLILNDPAQRRRAEIQANIKRSDFTPLQLAKAIAELDNLMRRQYGSKKSGPGIQEGWTQKETAKMLGFKSHASISDALLVAKAVETRDIPGLDKAKTMREALKMIKNVSKPKKLTIHKTFLPIEKITYLFYQGLRYELQLFDNENKFEEFICNKSKFIFGENNHYIDAKHKIKAKGFNAIPDGFLLDISDVTKPILYIVEIEISKHGFSHITPHIMKYNNLILTSRENIREIISEYFSQEVQLLLNRCLSQNNFGILIIIDKEDAKIEPLIQSKPEGIINYKIMSIESYKSMQSKDIIIASSEYLYQIQLSDKYMEERDLDNILDINLADFE